MTSLSHNQASGHDQKWDQSLLLMAHGALPWWPRLRVQAHLRRCAVCRDRQIHLLRTSVLVADAVRGPGLPAWSRAEAIFRASKTVSAGLIALALIVLVTALWLVVWTKSVLPTRPAASSITGGCRPDLPNSRCR